MCVCVCVCRIKDLSNGSVSRVHTTNDCSAPHGGAADGGRGQVPNYPVLEGFNFGDVGMG